MVSDYELVTRDTPDGRQYNFVTPGGSLLYEAWFDSVSGWDGGLAKVGRGSLWNWIRESDGGFLHDGPWFVEAGDFNRYGLARVADGVESYNWIRRDGGFLCGKWFHYAGDFDDGVSGAAITQSDKEYGYNYIKPDGSFVLDSDFDWIVDENNTGSFVILYKTIDEKNRYNILRRDTATLVTDTWYRFVQYIDDEYIVIVDDDDMENWMRLSDGTVVLKDWVKTVVDRKDGIGRCILNNGGWGCFDMSNGTALTPEMSYISGFDSAGMVVFKTRDGVVGDCEIGRSIDL